MPKMEKGPSEKRRGDLMAVVWAGLLLLAVVLVVFLPAFLGGFIWDDDAHTSRQTRAS